MATTDSAVSPLKLTNAPPQPLYLIEPTGIFLCSSPPCYAPVTAPSFFFLGFRFLPFNSPSSNLRPFTPCSPTRVLYNRWPNTAPSTPRCDPLA